MGNWLEASLVPTAFLVVAAIHTPRQGSPKAPWLGLVAFNAVGVALALAAGLFGEVEGAVRRTSVLYSFISFGGTSCYVSFVHLWKPGSKWLLLFVLPIALFVTLGTALWHAMLLGYQS